MDEQRVLHARQTAHHHYSSLPVIHPKLFGILMRSYSFDFARPAVDGEIRMKRKIKMMHSFWLSASAVNSKQNEFFRLFILGAPTENAWRALIKNQMRIGSTHCISSNTDVPMPVKPRRMHGKHRIEREEKKLNEISKTRFRLLPMPCSIWVFFFLFSCRFTSTSSLEIFSCVYVDGICCSNFDFLSFCFFPNNRIQRMREKRSTEIGKTHTKEGTQFSSCFFFVHDDDVEPKCGEKCSKLSIAIVDLMWW